MVPAWVAGSLLIEGKDAYLLKIAHSVLVFQSKSELHLVIIFLKSHHTQEGILILHKNLLPEENVPWSLRS